MFKLSNDNNILYNTKYNQYYYIHESGFVMNLKTGHITSSSNKQNYINIKQQKFRMDTLVYCKNNKIDYNNKIKLIHLDNNILNNDINNLKVGIKYNIKEYIPIKYQIIYKKYDTNFNLLHVYTNYKFIENCYQSIEFLKNLLDNNVLYTDTEIWEIEIIKINVNNTENYKFIPETLYKISKDNTHIIDINNKIYYYKVDKYDKQYILIKDINNIEKKIYYQYKKQDIDNYFNKFDNLIDIEEVNKYLYYQFYNEFEIKF
jgi:hypothetical protein